MRNDYYQAVQNCNIVSDSSERDENRTEQKFNNHKLAA